MGQLGAAQRRAVPLSYPWTRVQWRVLLGQFSESARSQLSPTPCVLNEADMSPSRRHVVDRTPLLHHTWFQLGEPANNSPPAQPRQPKADRIHLLGQERRRKRTLPSSVCALSAGTSKPPAVGPLSLSEAEPSWGKESWRQENAWGGGVCVGCLGVQNPTFSHPKKC